MNLRPVVLLPYAAATPGELTCTSPQALRGPGHAQWTKLGASRHYAGQMAIIAGQQVAFKRAFKTHYMKRLRLNHSMAVTGRDQFDIGDVVLVTDLSSSQGQAPYPVVGVISSFVDQLHAQAVVRYGAGRTVDRPLALLVKLVPATEQILEEGLLFDPFIQGDINIEQEQKEERQQEDVHASAPAPALGQQADARLVVPRSQEDTAPASVQEVTHQGQGEGDAAQIVLQGDVDGDDQSKQREMEDVEEDDEDNQSEQGQQGAHGAADSAGALTAPQTQFLGWQGGRRPLVTEVGARPTRTRRKIDKFV